MHRSLKHVQRTEESCVATGTSTYLAPRLLRTSIHSRRQWEFLRNRMEGFFLAETFTQVEVGWESVGLGGSLSCTRATTAWRSGVWKAERLAGRISLRSQPVTALQGASSPQRSYFLILPSTDCMITSRDWLLRTNHTQGSTSCFSLLRHHPLLVIPLLSLCTSQTQAVEAILLVVL